MMDPDEVKATIDDFFSDENESSETSDGDDDDIISRTKSGITQTTGSKERKKKKKKKNTGPSSALPSADLTPAEFRKRGKELVDFIADYLEGSRDRPVNHSAIQGFLFKKMSKIPPRDPVSMDDVYKDIKEFIFPGLPQWQSPKHHSLLPAGGSYASLLGSMLCDGLGCVGFTWADCPAATELEMLVMNWLAHLLDLPKDFHFSGKGASTGGGGIIQTTTTDALLTVTVSAKRYMLEHLKYANPEETEWSLLDKFMVYCSEQAHPSLERVCEIAGVRLKRLWTDRLGIMHGDTLRFAIEKDRAKGYYPFLVIATVGTIASTSVDQIGKIGPILDADDSPKIWFHIESGYAGSSFICREYQPLLHGIDYADSFSMSAHKWMPVHMDCACLWVKKITHLTQTFACEDPEGPLYIPADDKNIMADYRGWSLPMTRRFRAMKLWVVFKLYGVKGLQQKIREDVRRAKELEKLIGEDHRFEILGDVMFGVVPFRCKRPDNNDINFEILKQINKSAVIKMTGARIGYKFWLRFVISGRYTDSEDVKFSWDMIRRTTNKVIADYTERQHNEDRCGMPNYKHVIMIGKEERMDGDEKEEEVETHSRRIDSFIQ
ncbi:aromatic-L-amino-acid decarboxylase-like isoform X1 [Biomphalaria glabrata]|uniref:Aromatic-L-amino-acid decarboxylase-like n=1 Tax=Biomphalaria glabrata TaxID=6526 RepID=A0A2C9KMU2_BIOGL|nr:aromatic-L-amino-acid decarboxylase-like [Biomphalaria glabrata]KAI8741889.1 aromatic-L-amino-acid decarboxylase isoform X1 [Biomphalaria glabrata]